MINSSLVYIVIIILLILYIILLHYKLQKNSSIFNDSFEKLLNLKKNYTKEEFQNIITRIINFDFKLIVPKEKIQEEEIQNFIFEEENKTMVYLHYTKDKEIADKILNEGFKYRNSFYKTAENVFNDKVDFLNKHMRHKHFGDHIIVLSISKKTYNFYLNELSKNLKKDLLIEHIFSIESVAGNDNEDRIYTIPTQFIKGYINYTTGEIVKNKSFNYNFNSEIFKKNINPQYS